MDLEKLTNQHASTLAELSKPGHPLAIGAPTESIRNPWWFSTVYGSHMPTSSRRAVQNKIQQKFLDRQPGVESDLQAIVMSGPPGAGKSNVREKAIQEMGEDPRSWRIIDPDEFKIDLLKQAIDDKTYDSWLLPEEVRDAQEQGEQFFPLELSALVHEESSMMANYALEQSIQTGEKLVVDKVFSTLDSGDTVIDRLAKAGYSITQIVVDASEETSRICVRKRWEQGYKAALRDALKGGKPLGKRWVPSEYIQGLYEVSMYDADLYDVNRSPCWRTACGLSQLRYDNDTRYRSPDGHAAVTHLELWRRESPDSAPTFEQSWDRDPQN